MKPERIRTDETITLLPTTCWECSTLCGALASVRKGRVVDVAPNPAHPTSRGAFCVKGMRGLPESTYGRERITTPMRRVGARGSGSFERISWDSALDTMADRLADVRARHGPLAIAGAVSGAFFSRGAIIALLMRSLGSPNWLINQDLCGGCRGVSDMITGLAITGGEDIDQTACALVVGANLTAANPIQWARLKRAKARGARVVVIDPFRTPAADLADLWIRPRPGTDAAIALAMIDVMMRERLYDASFVRDWCHGFDALRERAALYSPARAAAIAHVKPDDIVAAAHHFARGPAVFVSGHGIDAMSNGVQTFRAFHSLVAISGNLDRAGGNRRIKRPQGFKTYLDLLHDPRFRLPRETESQTLGADRFPLWAGPDGWQTACHNPTVINAILTGKPYPVRAMIVSGVNIAVTYPDSARTLEALRSLDFLAVATHTMTPTAAVADIVLPKTTGLEEEEVTVQLQGPTVVYTAPLVPPQGEARPDIEMARGLVDRMAARGALTADFLPWRNQRAFNEFLIEGSNLSLDALAKDGFASFDYKLGNFAEQGFRTPTGKVELYSERLARLALDPLPDYVPLASASSSNGAYPLSLQTGAREKGYHHSRFREQAWARKMSPDPLLKLHPDTAAEQGVASGDWVWIETAGSERRCRLKVEVNDRTPPGLLVTGMGWWRPEGEGPTFGALDININAALSYGGPYDPMSGSADTRAIPCRIVRES
ncbi:MAG: molybdopterin-dependent oxidoreductase [Burkholderiales bacterium]